MIAQFPGNICSERTNMDEYRIRQIVMQEIDRALRRAGIEVPDDGRRIKHVYHSSDGKHTSVSYEYLPYGKGSEG